MFVRRQSNPELDPTRIPTPVDVAWAAGIYEGEGSVRGYMKRAVLVQMCQKDPECLYRLRDLFGGNVREYANPGIKKTGTIYKWTAAGDKARIFFALVYPYLTNRRKAQVDSTTALDFLGSEERIVFTLEMVIERLDAFYRTKDATLVRNLSGDDRRQYWRDIMRNWRARKKASAKNIVEIA